MKTIVRILNEINILNDSAPDPELGTGGKSPYVQDNTNMSTSDGRVNGFTPETFPVYRSASMEQPPEQGAGDRIMPIANGFGMNQSTHDSLSKLGKFYGVDIGPMPGTKEAIKLAKSNPEKQLKNLYLINNEIKHRERTTDIFNRLSSFGIDLSNNDIHKDYTNPNNHGEYDNMTIKTDLSQLDKETTDNIDVDV